MGGGTAILVGSFLVAASLIPAKASVIDILVLACGIALLAFAVRP